MRYPGGPISTFRNEIRHRRAEGQTGRRQTRDHSLKAYGGRADTGGGGSKEDPKDRLCV